MYKYQHGGDVYSNKLAPNGKPFVDFSANINPLGIPNGVKVALRNALKQCVNYPDPFCRELRIATAKFLQVAEENIFFGMKYVFGHVHINPCAADYYGNCRCVSAARVSYTPVDLDQLLKEMDPSAGERIGY